MTIRPGFSLVLSDLRYTDESLFQHLCGDNLKFHFRLGGESVIGGEHDEGMHVSPGVMSFLVQPPDSIKNERVLADSHERSITMICSRAFAFDLLSPLANALPSAITGYLRANTSRFMHSGIALPLHIRPIVEAILNPQAGRIGDLLVEAKALELLCFVLGQITDGAASTDTVKPRDRRKVEELRIILAEDSIGTYSIADLCKLLAWNETQMMECFKHVTGMTISSYRHRVRMDHALTQLRTTDASITEIAFDAGYEHASNFTTAFKRTFGCPPRAARAGFN